MKFRQLFSIPNLLCYFRILLIPFFAYSYLHAQTSADYLGTALIWLSWNVLISWMASSPAGFIW